MLQPREADLPVLLLVLVVLPLVLYILLGKWSETPMQKTRISMLAQLAAEEALRVAEVEPVNVTPHKPPSKFTFRECAMCFAPATTRCSKCKSVRYCSGNCQIIHWRQGHKQDCHQLASSRVLFSSSDYLQSKLFIDNSKQMSVNVFEERPQCDSLSDISTDGSLSSDTSYNMTSERKSSDFGSKSGKGSFTSSSEVSKCHDSTGPTYDHAPTTLIHVMDEPRYITDETENMLKPGFASHNSENESNEYKIGSICTSDALDEALGLKFSVEDASIRGSLMYRRPPYILGPTTSLSQTAEQIPRNVQSQGIEKRAYMNDESGSFATSVPTGSRKSSKNHKWNLRGLTKGCNKNKMLFPYEDIVKFYQCEVWGISPRGLLNCGNSCYANAVLQCLTCTKPLLVYLLRRSHSKSCRTRDWCLMCELEQHVSLLREGGGPLSPSRILSNMRNIGCQMGGGDQEDAHEFLRHLVMSMQSICLEVLGGEKEVNPRLQETTLIQQIFGGRLKSKVKCLRCHLESERYENIMDLNLEIHGWVESLEDALTQFTAAEDLDGENMYRCGRCAAYVRARKQLSVHEVPNILTIVLKRFQTGKYGKINKCVTFPEMLDMVPYVTGTADSPPLYMLYGVVVHLDSLNASFSGHYVSYVKDLQGTWFRIDDSEVQAVSTSEVMSEGAYMLFYSRSFPRPPRAYTEKASKTSKHKENSSRETSIPSKDKATSSEPFSMEFSDAMSSDWSLFTSSDESSSFTTESARDSVSTIDHSDPVSSIFAPPFYSHEYPQSNTTSCKSFSPCGLETRFFSERRGFIVDSSWLTCSSGNVHKGRNSKPSAV